MAQMISPGRETPSAGATRARAGERGFTIFEVLMTALLLMLIASATATALIATGVSSADERHRSQASGVAEQDQERLRGLSSTQLTGLNQNRVVALDGTSYQVNSTATFLSSSGGATCGSPGSGAAAYYRIVSTVNWAANQTAAGVNRQPPVVEESVITPPAGGILLAQVQDQTGAGLSGVSVAASGPDYASGSTDSSGCTYLADLQAGTYTLTFTDAGYVDVNGNASPLTGSATVTATGTSRPSTNPVVMGLAGQLNANFTATGNSGNLTGQQANALSWFGNGTSSRMSEYLTNTPASTPATVIPASGTVALFPFEFAGPSYAGNYQVWSGPCQQMEPPANYDKVSVAPGSSQTAAVQEPALDVIVQNSGTRVAPAHVKLSFASTSGTTCSATWSAPIAADAATNVNGSLASPGQPFATTATTGATASASGYTGTYTVCADASISGTVRKVSVSNVTNSNFAAPTVVTINILSSSTKASC
jgi:hypothetical protein